MDIDKSLNQAPIGLDLDSPDTDEGLDIEIEIEDPDAEEEEVEEEEEDDEFAENLAEDMDDGRAFRACRVTC
jgi:hypothetical protein